MNNHMVHVTTNSTVMPAVPTARSGVIYVVGTTPIQAATKPAPVGKPVVCKTWEEAVEKLGYSDDWATYTACEAIYRFFRVDNVAPVVFCNVLSAEDTTAVAAADIAVSEHAVKLPYEAIASTVVVKASGGGTSYVKGTDYDILYTEDGKLTIELLRGSSAYTAEQINVAYSKVDTEGVTTTSIVEGIQAVDRCITTVGLIPDILIAPGHSAKSDVLALLKMKATVGINSLFGAHALVDSDTTVFADNSSAVIPCYPMLEYDGKVYHCSTVLASTLVAADRNNDNVPCYSPSNQSIKCSRLVDKNGDEVDISLEDANALEAKGIVTALNFVNGWVIWGNYTSAKPVTDDPVQKYIAVSRMVHYVGNQCIRDFWARLDKPMTRVLVDDVVNKCNIMINGMVGKGQLLGGRVEYRNEDNTEDDLINGKVKLRIFLAVPLPITEIEFVIEYDISYVTAALAV